ncbi:MAG: pyridoxal-phosphate dependent enzyme, partial [Pseudomonadota bacterium]
MGLGAFKALGGVYAVAALLRQGAAAGVPVGEMAGEAARNRASGTVFVCASAGNHGMAVAAGARLFGAGCRIHLAETVPEAFARRLAAKGAEVVRSGATYEASIAAAIADAAATGAVHLADGSWPGYTHAPRLVMEGYTVMAEEMRSALEGTGRWPSHVFLQAGVGGLAAAVAVMIRRNWAVQPEIIVVEPEAAPCLAASHAAGACVR